MSENNKGRRAQEDAEWFNTGRKYSGESYSVLNGRTVKRKDGYNVTGQTGWNYLDGTPAGPYKEPSPKVSIPTGGRSTTKAAERRKNIEAAKTPFVPPAPSTSTRKGRKNNQARPSGGIQIGVPQSSPISTQRPNRSSNTTAETPTQNPERPGQPAGGVETPAFSYYDQARKANPEGTTRDFGTGYKEKELAAGQTAENHRAGAGFGGQTRVSPTGVVQRGTNTSPAPMTMDDANKLLTGGYTMNQQYASNQLPYTQTSPYSGKGNAEIYNQETLQQFDGDVDNVKLANDLFGGKSGVEKAKPSFQMGSDFKPMDAYGKGQTPDNYNVGEPLGKAGEPAESGKTDWLNRSAADNSDAKMARRRAFLDAKGSMQGLRRSEAVQGMTYAGGKHYIADGKGGDNLVEMGDKEDVRTYKSGEEGARQMRDKYVNALTSKDDSVEYQTDAPAMLPNALPGDTAMDKSPFDTEELMQHKPGKSIIGNNTPYTSVKPGTLYR
jgi:hypothetical protein